MISAGGPEVLTSAGAHEGHNCGVTTKGNPVEPLHPS